MATIPYYTSSPLITRYCRMHLEICSKKSSFFNNQATASEARDIGLAGWTMKRFRTVEDIQNCLPAGWQANNFWLRKATLSFLNEHPQGFETECLLVENVSEGHSLIFTLQIFNFTASGNVRDAAKGETSRYDIRRTLLSPFSFKVANLGQLLCSGPYAHSGLDNLPATLCVDLLDAVCETLLNGEDNFMAVILKDLLTLKEKTSLTLIDRGFYALPVDPVLELSIPQSWRSLDDYLLEVTSKYRVRYRRARGKMEGLDRQKLTAAEVFSRAEEIHALYLNTSSGADYNAAKLTNTYFPWLAGQLEAENGDSGFYGYFDRTRLVGFTSAINNADVYHAHYLGMVDSYKFSHHLYHNMLFDLLESALYSGASKLDYGRTALEIKSSIGAVPKDYACLIKAKSSVLNKLIPLFTPAVYRAQVWSPRSPFKSGE